MSLSRLVYYSAVVGGWTAFLAWAVLEAVSFRGGSEFTATDVTVAGAVVGAAIGVGLNLVSGMTNARWKRQMLRTIPGLIGGGTGGAVGGSLGCLLFSLVAPPKEVVTLMTSDWVALALAFALGWMFMGMAIGLAEGICERSGRSVRNGLIGGAIGGLLGGTLFGPISMASGSGMAARATAFVILGLSIGALIGLTQVVFTEAWLTVLDGFRPGRELILSRTVTVLGRGDHLPLPMLGYSGRELEAEHARITRKPNGDFVIEDNQSRLGTRVNGRPIQGLVTLCDGDLIKLGSNIVRFNLRHGSSRRLSMAVSCAPAGGAAPLAPPPAPSGITPPVAVPPPIPIPSSPRPSPPPGVTPSAGGAPPRPASPGVMPGQAAPPRPATPPTSPRIPPPPPPPRR